MPWADLLNHSPDADVCLDWDASSQSVVLRAEAAADPGQQLFASYGAKNSGALLLRFGSICRLPSSSTLSQSRAVPLPLGPLQS